MITKQKDREVTRGVVAAKKGIAARLEIVRGGRSQRQFARDIGVFQQNVNRYENGTAPHIDFAIRLALAEGISIDWLLLGVGRAPRVTR